MYGLIGKIVAVPGKRTELTAILAGMEAMAGCLNYVVAEDSSDTDAVWVTEVWETSEDHAASLRMQSVQAAIAQGRPLIAAFESQVETKPVGGIGLS